MSRFWSRRPDTRCECSRRLKRAGHGGWPRGKALRRRCCSRRRKGSRRWEGATRTGEECREIEPEGLKRLMGHSDEQETQENPRPALAERPGVSCSPEGCNSLVIVVIFWSAAYRSDGSVLVRQHVIPLDLTPFMSRWRAAKVVLPIIDLIASVPVFLMNL